MRRRGLEKGEERRKGGRKEPNGTSSRFEKDKEKRKTSWAEGSLRKRRPANQQKRARSASTVLVTGEGERTAFSFLHSMAQTSRVPGSTSTRLPRPATAKTATANSNARSHHLAEISLVMERDDDSARTGEGKDPGLQSPRGGKLQA